MRNVLNTAFTLALMYVGICILFWNSVPPGKPCDSLGQFLLEPIGLHR